jgi:serine/threonine-protein kinase
VETERPASTRNLPRTIGRYEILSRLGKGAMGVVYSAHDSMMERSVAIKVMMTDLEDDPETSARFYREARSAGQLIHPNIITIFDMGQEDGRPFIVMEYLEGDTLNKYMARPEAAPVEQKIDLMIQICEGLQAAHAHGIFHRDIKPGNLLVRPTGELKIVDFGIARLASSNMTASGLIVGTPDYMSPEQARGHDIDQRSDIFSAGAVFYFMLTGRKPFAAPDLTAVLMKVQTEDPLPIRETEAPPKLARFVMKALAKNPADRFQTCAQMVAGLEHLKRDMDDEARRTFEEAGRRLHSLETLSEQRRALGAALEITPVPADLEAARLELVSRHASMTEPYSRGAVADLLAACKGLHEPAAEEVARWQQASHAIDEGTRAMSEQRTREAVALFERALHGEPASRRAAHELDRCRSQLAQQRSQGERARTLVEEARKAAAAEQWQVVIDFCADALALDPSATEAATLKQQATAAIGAEARRAKLDGDRALDRAEAYRRKGRFQEAALEIARAREANPDNPEIDSADARLRASIAEAEHDALVEQQAADAIAGARSRFSAGERDAAIADLQAFHGRTPQPAVAAEVTRLEAESRRIAAEEARRAEAATHATQAEAALASGEARRALDLASKALANDPANALARKVSGLATAELKQRAEAEARAADASRQIEEAKRQLQRGKYQKARSLVSGAAALNPENSQHKLVLAQIDDEEKHAAAEHERQRLEKHRAKAVAPILERARAAEAQRDFERAAWTAENALAVDLECAEAREILKRAKAQLAADPRLADETVDLTNGTGKPVADPDDTASFTQPVSGGGVWAKLTDMFRRT